MNNYKARIEMLQESHKHLDRKCTDLEKKKGSALELKELKKQKLNLRDQIAELKRQQQDEAHNQSAFKGSA
tara:strand:+ start:409 stop:621 length:213 start_codon:yes stop_codon:yes gene_type:complete